MSEFQRIPALGRKVLPEMFPYVDCQVPCIVNGWPTDAAVDTHARGPAVVVASIGDHGNIVRQIYLLSPKGLHLAEHLDFPFTAVTGINIRKVHDTSPEMSHNMVQPTDYFRRFTTETEVDVEIRRFIGSEKTQNRTCFVWVEVPWANISCTCNSDLRDEVDMFLLDFFHLLNGLLGFELGLGYGRV